MPANSHFVCPPILPEAYNPTATHQMSECHCGKDGHALNSIKCSIHGCLADVSVNRVARAIATEWFGKEPPEDENEWWLAGLVSAHKLARAAMKAK